MQTPDIFWGFTATGWTAIGSLVSAASLIALAIFNVFYLRRAHEQSKAAIAQAQFAKTTLETLHAQILTEKKTEHFNAYAILARCAVELVQWSERLSTEQRSSGDEQVTLIPSDWNIAATYVSRDFPDLHSTILNLASRIKQLESRVNMFVRTSIPARSPNSSLGQGIQQTRVLMNQLSFELNQVMYQISQ